MIHQDFTDFSQVVQLAQPELAYCPRATIFEAAAMAFMALCEKTQCYKEVIEFDASNGELDLISPHEGAQVAGVDKILIDDKELMRGEYEAHSLTHIVFEKGKSGKVVVNMKPTYDAQTAPASIINAYAETIANGTKGRLMLSLKMPWADPSMGQYYQGLFEVQCLRISADVRNSYSITRSGRAPYQRSVYGV